MANLQLVCFDAYVFCVVSGMSLIRSQLFCSVVAGAKCDKTPAFSAHKSASLSYSRVELAKTNNV